MRNLRNVLWSSWRKIWRRTLDRVLFFLPFVVDELLEEKKATVKVLKSADKWYGVTYKEDKPMVMAAVQN